ncbi:multidrug resistance efflux transporter family protein [Kroppenstedtia eburnea]|uniref:DMT family transporter n=1 Tax=Kroppenstedtia eburnea TaxID=714067 RepID=UPI003639D73E
MRAMMYGLAASLFFAVTFILNRSMEISGGNWIWSASLRFLFMIPFLMLIVGIRGKLAGLWVEMRRHPVAWLGWSLVGFGLFYAPLCFAAAYGPGWLIASTFQVTIVAGTLLAPLFRRKIRIGGVDRMVRERIPVRGLALSSIILFGIVVMQSDHARSVQVTEVLLGALPVLMAAFAYPLGNRKMMEICEGRLDTFQRVLGMTLASLPLWVILSCIGWTLSGPPGESQIGQTFIVALSSGVIATVLFFRATDLVREDQRKLSAVEATQSGEVIFAALGELILFPSALPSPLAITGMGLIVAGIICHSRFSHEGKAVQKSAV